MTEIIGVGIAFDPSGAQAGVTAAESQFDRIEQRATELGTKLDTSVSQGFDTAGTRAKQAATDLEIFGQQLSDVEIAAAETQFDAKFGDTSVLEKDLDELSQVVQRNKADFQAGRLSAEQYAASLADVRAATLQISDGRANLSTTEVGKLNRVLRQTAPSSRSAQSGLRSVSRGLVAMGAQAAGARGGISTLLSSFVTLGSGATLPILAIAGGLAGIAIGYKFLTKKQRESREELDKFIEKQLEAARLDIDPGANLQKKLDETRQKINELDQLIERLSKRRRVGEVFVSGEILNVTSLAKARKELVDLNEVFVKTREDTAAARGELSKTADEFFELADAIEFEARTMGLSRAQAAILAVELDTNLIPAIKKLAIERFLSADATEKAAQADAKAAAAAERSAEAERKAAEQATKARAQRERDRAFAAAEAPIIAQAQAFDDLQRAEDERLARIDDLTAAIQEEFLTLGLSNDELVLRELRILGVDEITIKYIETLQELIGVQHDAEDAAVKSADVARVAWERSIGSMADFTTDFINSAVSGFDNLGDVIDAMFDDLRRLLSSSLNREIFNQIAKALPFPSAAAVADATGGGGAVVRIAGPQRPIQEPATVVHQSVTFVVNAIDDRGVEGVLQRHKGTILQVVAEGAQRSKSFRNALLR